MAHEEDDDLYDEEFDFVDEDDVDDGDESDDESDVEEEESSAADSDLADEPAPSRDRAERSDRDRGENDRVPNDDQDAEPAAEGEEPLDEYGRPEQIPANYVVHVYEARKFHRTIDRPFTPEDAEAFATEFNRTAKNYNRFAVTGKNDAKPKKSLD